MYETVKGCVLLLCFFLNSLRFFHLNHNTGISKEYTTKVFLKDQICVQYYLIVCGCYFQSFFYHVSDVLNSYIMDKISSDSYPPKVPYNYLINMLRIINGLFQMQNGSVRGQTCINVDKQFYDNQQM